MAAVAKSKIVSKTHFRCAACKRLSSASPNVSYFTFPKDHQRCNLWLMNCGRLDLQSKSFVQLHTTYRLCEDHFHPSQFLNTGTKRLKWNAVPTLFTAHTSAEPVKSIASSTCGTNQLVPDADLPSVVDSGLHYVPESTCEIYYQDLRDVLLDEAVVDADLPSVADSGLHYVPESTCKIYYQDLREVLPDDAVVDADLLSVADSGLHYVPESTCEIYYQDLREVLPDDAVVDADLPSVADSGLHYVPESTCEIYYQDLREVLPDDAVVDAEVADVNLNKWFYERRPDVGSFVQCVPDIGSGALLNANINNDWSYFGQLQARTARSQLPQTTTTRLQLPQAITAPSQLPQATTTRLQLPQVMTARSQLPQTSTTIKGLKLKIRQLRAQVSRLKRNKSKQPTEKSLLTALKSLLPEKTFDFIQTQIKMNKVKKRGERWSLDDKLVALSIFYQSRKAYKVLKKIFRLPSPRTLQRAMQNSKIDVGFNEEVFRALSSKFRSSGVTSMDKDCVLVFDEISLKSALCYNKEKDCIDGFEDFGLAGRTQLQADHALVFMLRGISRKWKQPLGYFLICGTVKPAILQSSVHSCLSKLFAAGVNVRAIICDQGSTNRCFLEKLERVSMDKPYIMNNNNKIFVLYDPPHLLKNIRNNLKKHGFVYKDEFIIKWSYIEDFFNHDKQMSIRMAPRLTEKHLELPPFSSMRVCLAAQTLSHSVAAGIETLCSLSKMNEDAHHTAQFLENFDQLFNAFNSCSIKSSRKMSHAFTRNGQHETFLLDMLDYISHLRLHRSNIDLPCLHGWKLSITSILQLWKVLLQSGYKFLLTRRFNQDCIENLFSVIRGRGGNRDNPDHTQFKSSFRHIVVDMLFCPSLGNNCELDYDQILLNLDFLLKPKLPVPTNTTADSVISNHSEYSCELNMSCDDESYLFNANNSDFVCSDLLLTVDELSSFDADFANSSIPVTVSNVALYIGGYMLRKNGFLKSDACTECKSLYISPNVIEDVNYTFINKKTYNGNLCLIYPTAIFLRFVEKLELIFIHNFPILMHSFGICRRLIDIGHSASLPSCGKVECSQLIHSMIRLFMIVRIHAKIKIMNRATVVKCIADKRNRKAKKILHE